METTKAKTWLILEITSANPAGFIPAHLYNPAQEYETRAAARLAAFDVVERFWTKYHNRDLADGISHRVTVGQCDSDGNVVTRDDRLVVTARRDSVDGDLQMMQVFESRPLEA